MVRRATYGYKACINCKNARYQKGKNTVQNCKGKDFSDEWSGIFILFKPEESQLAKILGIKNPGMYAIKVR